MSLLTTETLLAIPGSLSMLCTLTYYCGSFLRSELKIQPQQADLHFEAAELDYQNSDFALM